ncbi:MAG TPA: hypothetical protein VMT86_10230 [Bryobacteraceae bacterium]|nr:hypothetical protein [Bryobacteraceae bacterium]
MISVKEAAAKAVEFAQALLNLAPGEVLLEEVESSTLDSAPVWLITLSVPPRPLPFGRRDYKTFTVRADTGEVLSMKIRELAGA